ncbi:putative porin [Cellvibrio sp.]|uniref:putative porin n=1 Tax=Cellvibrio sp. TaxID=1965322 RepID=UPI0039647CD0
MKFKLMFAATLLATSGFAIADSYQAEVGASATRWDVNRMNSRVNSYEADGKYYFSLVKTDNVPLAEAAYLGKSSNAFLTLVRNSGRGFFSDSNIYSGGVEVYIPENFLYVRVEGMYQRSDGSSDTSALTTIGLTPLDGLRLTTSWNSDESYHANIDAKYVTSLGEGQFINVEASVVDTDQGTKTTIGGDYYFDTSFSVGAEVSDDKYSTDYLIRTRKFFTESFSGELDYVDTDFGNLVALGVSYRF